MSDRSHKRVALGLSGGVDSAMAARLLIDEGFDVIGVHVQMTGSSTGGPASQDVAESLDPAPAYSEAPVVRAAVCVQQTAAQLGIRLVTFDARRAFAEIIGRFCSHYASGLTPNPCTWCNPQVKFRVLREVADAEGARFVATGHYARTALKPDGSWALLTGLDLSKDQSYGLFALPREALARIFLPLGERAKADIKRLARQIGLSAADQPESQDICFLDGDRYTDYLRQRMPGKFAPGPIVDLDGRELGQHRGYLNYTVGQRRGLRLPMGRPVYVVRVEPQTNTVVVGPAEALQRSELVARGARWLRDVNGPLRARVKIRYRSAPAQATITPLPSAEAGRFEAFRAEFDRPVMAVTPGQAAVIYDGPEVVGGGWIASGAEAGGADFD